MMLFLKLDLKPMSVNRAWQGRRFKSREYLRYISELTILLRQAQIQRMEGDVQITYRFFLKRFSTTDGDNLVKPLQDVLVQNGVIPDDRHILRYVIEKYPSKVDRIEIEIEKYTLKGEM